MKTKRGAALILAYAVIAALTVISGAFLMRTVSERKAAESFSNSKKAFWAAEAGLQRAIKDFKADVWDEDDWQDYENEEEESYKYLTESGGPIIYALKVFGLSSHKVTLKSAGYYPDLSSPGYIKREVSVVYQREGSESLFKYAAFGNSGVSLSGSARIDSYDSEKGPYGGENVYENGHVAGIGWSSFYDLDNPEYPFFEGGVFLTGSSRVLGGAEAGTHAVFSYPTWWGYDVPEDWFTGGTSIIAASDLENAYKRFIEVPSEISDLPSSGSKTITGSNKETLGPGNYSFSKIDIGGNAQLTLEGDVNIYLTSLGEALKIAGSGRLIIDGTANIYIAGDAKTTGAGIVTGGQSPANFTLYGSPTTDNIDIQGSGSIYGGIYAPSAAISVTGNARLFGAAVGDTVTVTGSSKIHYDEALSGDGSGSGSGDYVLQYWREDRVK